MFIFIFLFSLYFVSCVCEENQIDINNASLEDLDKLTGIGPAKAQSIINSRPFSSVDDLIRVSGIGEVTLNNIKAQGLACVNEEKIIIKQETKVEETQKTSEVVNQEEEIVLIETPKNMTLNPINLEPKDIKKQNDKGFIEFKPVKEKDWIVYGFFAFSLLIGLLLITRRKKYIENEFRE